MDTYLFLSPWIELWKVFCPQGHDWHHESENFTDLDYADDAALSAQMFEVLVLALPALEAFLFWVLKSAGPILQLDQLPVCHLYSTSTRSRRRRRITYFKIQAVVWIIHPS